MARNWTERLDSVHNFGGGGKIAYMVGHAVDHEVGVRFQVGNLSISGSPLGLFATTMSVVSRSLHMIRIDRSLTREKKGARLAPRDLIGKAWHRAFSLLEWVGDGNG